MAQLLDEQADCRPTNSRCSRTRNGSAAGSSRPTACSVSELAERRQSQHLSLADLESPAGPGRDVVRTSKRSDAAQRVQHRAGGVVGGVPIVDEQHYRRARGRAPASSARSAAAAASGAVSSPSSDEQRSQAGRSCEQGVPIAASAVVEQLDRPRPPAAADRSRKSSGRSAGRAAAARQWPRIRRDGPEQRALDRMAEKLLGEPRLAFAGRPPDLQRTGSRPRSPRRGRSTASRARPPGRRRGEARRARSRR